MIKDCNLFRGLSEENSKKISLYFKKISFAKKQQIVFPSSSKDYIYLVSAGRVKVSYLSPEGKEITVTILGPGDLYSLHSEASTIVLEAAEIWYIDSDDFKKMILENPNMIVNLIRILGLILKNTNDALLNLAFKEVNSRLAAFLMKTAKEKGTVTEEGIRFRLGLTHEEIATVINSTRQTVTTVLNRFEKAGIINVNKKEITIIKYQDLAELS